MGQSSVRGEKTRGRVPRARELGWDDDPHGAGEATGTGGGAPEKNSAGVDPAPAPRAPRRRGGGKGPGDDDAGGGRGARGRAAARRRAKKTGKRRVLRWMAITLSVLILGTAGAGYLYYEHLNGNIRSGGRAGGDSGVQKAAPNALGNTPLNILLIGSDSREDPKNVALGGGKDLRNNKPLADVQMLLHVSADRKNASVVSIPRDTVVPIPQCTSDDGSETYPATTNQPINETLGRGGPGCTLTTWESLTGVYIDHWVMLDFAGVVAMADAIGGVPVCVKSGVSDHPTPLQPGGSGLKLPEGTTEIKGEQALQWLRTRHAFGSDQNRAKAQHMYMNGMVERLQQQNAWTDTGRLMGLADTATKALQVSDELNTVKSLFDLSMQLKNVKLDRLTTANIPTAPWPQDENKNVLVKSSADKMFAMLRDDVAFDKNGNPADAKPQSTASAEPKATAEAPGTLSVTVLNGTGSDGEPAAEGRARTVSEILRGKGFTRAEPSHGEASRKDTVVSYPKAAGEQGKANAQSVAKALGLPDSAVRVDLKAEGVTLVVGADWREGTVYEKPAHEEGDLPDGAQVLRGSDKDCMTVFDPYKWDGKS
ncbi:LCP family protein [Streptomyces sp. NPDC058877]|uniref:LCP family protein n=1 Tax=unclassified Streptomyces TaxID=2593676 RepID=UPI003685C3A1